MASSFILVPNGAVRRRRGGHHRSDVVQAWHPDGHVPGDPRLAGFRVDAFRADGYSGALSLAVDCPVVSFQVAVFPVDAGQVAACQVVDCPEAASLAADYQVAVCGVVGCPGAEHPVAGC